LKRPRRSVPRELVLVRFAINDAAGASLRPGADGLLRICGQREKLKKAGSMSTRAMPQMII